MVFCLLVFASPGPFTEFGSADGKPLSATSAPATGCVIHTLVYYITFSLCAQPFCPVSAEKLTYFRRIPLPAPMLFCRLIVLMGGGSFALSLLRTEPALRAAPVFRMAYSGFRTIAHAGAGVSLGLFGKPKRSSFSCIRSLHHSALRYRR